MPPKDETLQILVQIAGDIGETRGDIASLKSNVDTITEDFKEVKDQLSGTVTKPECTQRHVVVSQSLDSMKKDILAEIRKPSGMHQKITPEMLRAAAAPTMQEIEESLNQKKESIADKKRKAITFWLVTISTVVALLSGCVVGVYKFVLFMDNLENVVSTKSDEVKYALKKSQNSNNVVYIRVPASPDVGLPAPLPVPPKKAVPKKR